MKFNMLKNKEKNANLSSNINKKTREKSLGRSMVEMLGVLAIIGVLSIGGIQGYTIAMRKHKANEILNALEKYATILYTNCIANQLNSGDELYRDEYKEKDFLNCPTPIAFEKAGIGGMPNGMIELHDFPSILPDIIRTDSGDMVRLLVEFENQQLCQTAMNIAGIIPLTNHPFGLSGYCDDGYDHPWLWVSFIMN